MKYRLFFGLSVWLFAIFSAFGGDIIINEIMYHPASENVREEYVELYNRGTNAISLAGWRLSKGVSFTISNNVALGAGEYLVIAADLAAFRAKYPSVTNVIGGWDGVLSNTGEEVQLENVAGGNEDSVSYADEGDWAIRQRGPFDNGHYGWQWQAQHDGLGSSLELINPLLGNKSGQNWASSATLNGTPGAPNSVRSLNTAPLIEEVQHSPAIPKSTDAVTVTAQITDESAGALTVQLFYRNAGSSTPPSFSSVPMFDDGLHNDGVAGDSIFGAILPAQPNRTVIEFYVQAADNGGHTRTWPTAARQFDSSLAQTANAIYQVDDSVYAGTQPVIRLILTETERAELATGDIRFSNAEMNGTMISADGTGTKVRYNVGIRIRGAGSRGGANVPNYRVDIPSDRRWNGVREINLNTQFVHSQLAGSLLCKKAGVLFVDDRILQVRVNGANLASSGLPQFGSYVLLEVVDSDWAAHHLPDDPNGNVYVARRPNTDLSYLGTDPSAYLANGYEKNSNGSENDWSDLIHLTFVLNNTPPENFATAFKQVANVESWIQYFAIHCVFGSGETSLGTGVGDDYDMYRGLVDTRFRLIPHDWDTILNQGQGPQPATSDIFLATALPVVSRFLKNQEFAPLYFAELKRLADTVMSSEKLDPLLDQTLGDFVPAQTIASMKSYGAARNAYVRSQIPLNITLTTNMAVVSGYLQTNRAAISLSGRADAIQTRSVLVNGSPAAWTAWQAGWSNSVALRPGINRVLVQALDAAGNEFQRATFDIWYDSGASVSVGGTLAADTTWTAAQGPYLLTSPLSIPAGRTLTIQAGTTVFLNPGVDISIANGGRILAEGTDTAPIWISRIPGAGGWAGITVNGAVDSPETRITYAHIEGNSATAIHSTAGTVFLDHLTFGTRNQQYVSLDGSSFVVSHCVFPTPTAGFEMAHGTQGIKAGGRGIFLRNFFGAANGYNDTIDFTGGNRPGPILQVIDNVFTGTGDDILDLDSTDAWVEGNIFMHAHQNGAPDSSSGVSGGADNADTSQVTIIGNIFYDCDQVANGKQGNFYTLINNTIVHQSHVGGQDTDGAVVILADAGTVEGAGMYLEGNVIYDAEKLVRNQTASIVTFTNNLMTLPWSGPGGANSSENPRLKYIPQLSETTNFTSWEQAQVFRDWFSLRPGSPGIGTGPNGRDKGAMIPIGISIFGEPAGTTSDASATLRLGVNRTGNGIPAAGFPNGSGYTHYKWRLDGGTWSAETPIGSPISLTGLANGPHRVEAIGKRDSDFYQNDPVFAEDAVISASRTWTVNTGFAGTLVLNEVLARNTAAVQVGGEYPDLIELYNGAAGEVDLSGMGLTDDVGSPFRFKFPAGTFIGSRQYLVLNASSEQLGGYTTGFGLDQHGSGLYLFSPAGLLIDSVQFGAQIADYSIGRLADGTWALTKPTFGAANVPQPLGEAAALRINEWLAEGSSSFPDDFVELYNRDGLPVALHGLSITDEPVGAPWRNPFADLSFIGAFGHLAFFADDLSFKISPEVGQIALLSSNGVIDLVCYGPQSAGVSQGRKPSGADQLAFFGPGTQSQPTPNAPNPGLGGNINITNIIVPLLAFTSPWSYEASGTDLGTSWRAPTFDDSAWLSGPGLLYNENNPVVPFRNTFLPYTSPQQITFYFRTKFIAGTNLDAFALRALTYIDDGAVIYINGSEVARIRMPTGDIGYSILAIASPPDGDATLEVTPIPNSAIVPGTNFLAVEVHQQLPTSSDIVWGMALEGSRFVTNLVASFALLNEVMANNNSYTNSDGTITDWVELYNPQPFALDLSNQSLTDDVANPRRWVFPSGTSIPASAYLVVRFDPDASASTNSGGILNTGFGLGAKGDEVLLFDSPERGGSLLDSIAFGLQTPDYSIGRMPDGGASWTLNLPTAGSANIAAAMGSQHALVINEWMANPKSGDDWFEIYNPENQPVALAGLYLTDDLNNRTKSKIPALSFISRSTNGFAQFFADNNPQNGPDHVDFRLNNGGEAIGLTFPNGDLIDAITFGPQQSGVSEGHLPDGNTNIIRFVSTPSPAESNYLPLEQVVINEALTHSDPPLEDAIELRNLTSEAIDISGWYISDSNDALQKFRIPNDTIIGPGGYIVFYENQFNPDPPFFPSFALSSAHGDQIYLSAADTNGSLTGYRTIVKFGAAESGVSFGRYETSEDFDFTAMTQRSFGSEGAGSLDQFRQGKGAPNSAPKVGPIVINEIMYHPPDIGGTNDNTADEFIELYNISASAIPLFDTNNPSHTWRLRDAADFNFPTNITLPVGGYLVLVSFDPAFDPAALAAFRGKYGVTAAVPVFGPYRGKLDNSKDSVELSKPDAPESSGFVPYVLVDKVHYKDSAPWPTAADSGTNNISIQRKVPSQYGNDAVNWSAGVPTAGRANGPAIVSLPSISSQPASQTVAPGVSVSFTAAVSGATPLTYQWRFNGVDLPGALGSTLTISNAQLANSGAYRVRVSNAAGATISDPAVLVLQVPPQITLQPQNRIVAAGSSATFNVSARGTPPLYYQWRFNGASIPSANGYQLVISNITAGNAGSYDAVITNAFGVTNSAVATLVIQDPPLITTPPVSQTILAGSILNLSVAATGTAPLSYQWRVEGLTVPNASGPTLTLSNVQPSQSGRYTVRVSNAVGSVVSQAALISIVTPPTLIITALDSSASELGDTGTFRISRLGSTNFALQVGISVSGTAISDQDFQPISSPINLSAGASFVDVVVTPKNDNIREGAETVTIQLAPGAGYVLGNPQRATVFITDDDNAAPIVTITSPVSGTVFPFTPTNITISASATDTDGTIQRVEFYNFETNLLGVVNVFPYTFIWTNAAPGSNLVTAVTTDDLGATGNSLSIALNVNIPPVVSILSPLSGQTFPPGSNVLIHVAATDADGRIAQMSIFQGSNLLARLTNTPFDVTWSSSEVGSYTFYAVAQDNLGMSATSAVVNIAIKQPKVGFGDLFEDRGDIAGYANAVLGNNSGASREAGEPRAYAAGTRTVWLRWVSPATGICVIDTFGSSFDTVLAVYTNNPPQLQNLSNLGLVTENDDWNGAQSLVSFQALEDTPYQIRIEGFGISDFGNIVLHHVLATRGPHIATQPQSLVLLSNATANFSFTAAATEAYTNQWRFNGTNIIGATNFSLTISNVQPAKEGEYTVLVGNAFGVDISVPARLEIGTRPRIILQPVGATVVEGSSVTFVVGTTGTLPMTYRWRKGAEYVYEYTTNSNTGFFTLANLRTNNSGTYFVALTNSVGPAQGLSQAAILTVLADSDKDGIPDVWESAYGLNPFNPSDGQMDLDGDGMTNWQEYIAGTNPLDSTSYLKVSRFGAASGIATVTFEAGSNKTYTVQFNNSLDRAAWTRLENVPSRTTNRTVSVIDPAALNANRFYRLATPQLP